MSFWSDTVTPQLSGTPATSDQFSDLINRMRTSFHGPGKSSAIHFPSSTIGESIDLYQQPLKQCTDLFVIVPGLFVVCRFLLAVASFVAEHRLGCMDSGVEAHWLSCPVARGILLDQGLNPCLLHWQADSYPLYHQGSPQLPFKDISQKPAHSISLSLNLISKSMFSYIGH